MAENIGYLQDENEDLLISGGSFVLGNTLGQEVRDVLSLSQGGLGIAPLLGPNLIRLMKAPYKDSDVVRLAKLHLKMDGKEARGIRVVNGSLIIDPDKIDQL